MCRASGRVRSGTQCLALDTSPVGWLILFTEASRRSAGRLGTASRGWRRCRIPGAVSNTGVTDDRRARQALYVACASSLGARPRHPRTPRPSRSGGAGARSVGAHRVGASASPSRDLRDTPFTLELWRRRSGTFDQPPLARAISRRPTSEGTWLRRLHVKGLEPAQAVFPTNIHAAHECLRRLAVSSRQQPSRSGVGMMPSRSVSFGAGNRENGESPRD